MKRLGILGGMGPYATMMFYNKILDCTKANKDWEHIPTIIDIATDVPSRTLAAMDKESIEQLVEKSAKHMSSLWFDNYCDIIAAPCNSFHYYRNDILSEIDINWPDMIEIVSNKVKSEGYTKPLILGGWIPNNKREEMYSKYFPKAVYLEGEYSDTIYKIIENIKLNRKDFTFGVNPIECDSIILACTELTNLTITCDKPVFDSSSIYAEEIVKLCKE